MTAKIWNVGDVLTASDVNVFLAPLSGVKSANQSATSSTLINDADMRFPVAANSIYEFHAYIRFDSGTGQDFKSSFTVPAGAFAKFQRIGRKIDGTFVGDDEWSDTDSIPSQGRTLGVLTNSQFMGVLVTAGTAGTLIFQWAQNTTGAGSPATLHQYSYLTGRRIG